MSRFDARVEMFLSGIWYDITDKVYQRDPIQISRGRQDESARVDPANCSLTLDNRDGRFSPRNPTGPYFGQIGRNTPLRVVLGTPTKANGDGAEDSSTSHVAPSVTSIADTALVIGAWCSGESSGSYSVPGSMTADTATDGDDSTMRTAHEELTAAGDTGDRTATFTGSVDGHAQALIVVPGDDDVPSIEELLVQSGPASASTPALSVFTAETSEEGWWLLAVEAWSTDPLDQMPLLPSGTPGRWTQVCDTGPGDRPRIRAWVRRVDFPGSQRVDFEAPLTTTTIDQHVRVYTLSNVRYSSIRLVGEVSSWPPRWDTSDTDVYVPIAVSGILRRLGQGAKPLHSAMHRYMTGQKPEPAAYWSFEDAEGSSRVASGVERQPYMAITKGTPELAAFSDFVASDPISVVRTASFATEVVGYAATGVTRFQWLMRVAEEGTDVGTNMTILRFNTTGRINRVDVVRTTGETLSVRLFKYNDDDESPDAAKQKVVSSVTQAFPSLLYGRQVVCSLLLTEIGGNLHYELSVRPVDSEATVATGNLSNVSLGAVWRVHINPDRALGDVAFGHLSLRSDNASVFDLFNVVNAYTGEPAGRRIERLCREEGINFTAIGPLDETSLMGPQTSDTMIELLGQCSDADQGILHETREDLGLTYRTRWSLYNQGLPIPDAAVEGITAGTVVDSPVTGGGDDGEDSEGGGSDATGVLTYTADFARSWNASGSMRGGSDAPLYQGQNNGNIGGHGNQKSWVWFDWDTIWADLAGKTIVKAELYLYADHWHFDAGGTAILGYHTAEHRNSYDASQDNIDEKRSSSWPKPGGRWVNITGSSIATAFANGTAKGITIGPGASTGLTYYGIFEPPSGSGSKAPKLRFTVE